MATLDDLPDEILLLICKEVPVRAIQQLLRVSKRLYKVALPFYYRRVTVENEIHLQRLFCATFVLREDLAELVESVHADPWWDDNYEDKTLALNDEKGGNIDDEATIDRLVARVRDIFRDDEQQREAWQRGIEVQDTKYMVPLALAHLPNVTDFKMTYGYETGFWDNLDVIITQMRNDPRLAAEQKPVQKVEHVVIDSQIDKYPLSPLPLAFAAKWPAVRSISMGVAGDEGQEVTAAFTDLEPRSRDLERLELCPNSKLLGGNLHGLLCASRGLREFKYHMGHAWAWIDFHTSELQESLDQHQETIERLTLWFDLLELEGAGYERLQPMNFSTYTHLTHLSIETIFLFDIESDSAEARSPRLAQQLPASLVSLHVVQVVFQAAKRVATGLATFLGHKRNFPELKELEVSCEHSYLVNHGVKAFVVDSGLRDLAPLAKDNGVEFRLIKCVGDRDVGMMFIDVDFLDPKNDVEAKAFSLFG